MTGMDRKMVQRHLEQTRRHVIEGEVRIARQAELVAKLERHGFDLTEPSRLLAVFEAVQNLNIARRDQLEVELARLS